MTTTTTPNSIVWPSALAASTVLGSFALACVFPFAAMAALAALTLDRRSGLALVTGAWAVNQMVGFFLLSFPWDAQAVRHGIAILGASLAGYGVARAVAARVENPIAKGGAALVAAFVVYEALLFAYAQIGGGVETFAPAIVAEVARNDALWFAGLIALRFLLTRATGEKLLPAHA